MINHIKTFPYVIERQSGSCQTSEIFNDELGISNVNEQQVATCNF